MPSLRIACRWLEGDVDFQHKYVRAREDQAERNAEQIVTLADEINRPGVTMEEIAVAKLRIDARKWIASKLLPKKYGEKGTEVSVTTTAVNVFALTVEQQRELQERRRIALGG